MESCALVTLAIFSFPFDPTVKQVISTVQPVHTPPMLGHAPMPNIISFHLNLITSLV